MEAGLRRLWWPLLLLAIVLRLYTTSPPPDLDSYFSNLEAGGMAKSMLVLTAHPDDEAMFFSPSILHLIKSGWDIHGLCMSIGNATGLGEIRRRELAESYRILGVPRDHVHYVNDPALQDSMTVQWDSAGAVLPHLQSHLDKQPASAILTFDNYGVTNHPNHVALPIAAKLIDPSIPVFTLRSPSLATKFTGPLWKLVVRLRGTQGPDTAVIRASPEEWWIGIRAMLEHQSQLVWFRWLYLGFSRLMWVNELVLL